MPYKNEHAARIKDPGNYDSFARKSMGTGVTAILGIKDGKSEVQSFRFDKTSFSPEQARKWLKDHDYSPTEFAAALQEYIPQYADVKLSIIGGKKELTQEEIDGGYRIVKGLVALEPGTYNGVEYDEDVLRKGAPSWINRDDNLKPFMKINHSDDMRDRAGPITDSYWCEEKKAILHDIILKSAESVEMYDKDLLTTSSVEQNVFLDYAKSVPGKLKAKEIRGTDNAFVTRPACKTCGIDILESANERLKEENFYDTHYVELSEDIDIDEKVVLNMKTETVTDVPVETDVDSLKEQCANGDEDACAALKEMGVSMETEEETATETVEEDETITTDESSDETVLDETGKKSLVKTILEALRLSPKDLMDEENSEPGGDDMKDKEIKNDKEGDETVTEEQKLEAEVEESSTEEEVTESEVESTEETEETEAGESTEQTDEEETPVDKLEDKDKTVTVKLTDLEEIKNSINAVKTENEQLKTELSEQKETLSERIKVLEEDKQAAEKELLENKISTIKQEILADAKVLGVKLEKSEIAEIKDLTALEAMRDGYKSVMRKLPLGARPVKQPMELEYGEDFEEDEETQQLEERMSNLHIGDEE